jgi:hypothetical protein
MEECCNRVIEVLSNNTIPLWTLILTVVSTLLWGIYVFFTIKTFREIKEQTILQSRSFLVVKPVLSELTDLVGFNADSLSTHALWKLTLQNNLPEAMKQENCFSLQLMNRGKSDIIKWSIKIKVIITVGQYLTGLNIAGNNYQYTINSSPLDQIGPGQEICIKVLPYGFYPKAEISWTISYEDIRNNKGTVSENNKHTVSNLLAYDFQV